MEREDSLNAIWTCCKRHQPLSLGGAKLPKALPKMRLQPESATWHEDSHNEGKKERDVSHNTNRECCKHHHCPWEVKFPQGSSENCNAKPRIVRDDRLNAKSCSCCCTRHPIRLQANHARSVRTYTTQQSAAASTTCKTYCWLQSCLTPPASSWTFGVISLEGVSGAQNGTALSKESPRTTIK